MAGVINHKCNLSSHFPQLPLFPYVQSEDVRFKEELEVTVSNLKWTLGLEG